MAEQQSYRLGCDIGGTFTDFVLLDEATGGFACHKVLTTPGDPSEAVEFGVAQLDERHEGFLSNTDYAIHGTTLVINAILERKGAKTGLIATEGFRDVLEMRREIRYDIYDIDAVFPAPMVPRADRREVKERLHSDGSVRVALDEDQARDVLAGLAADGIESVAVALLHSYANPAHEEAIGRIAADEFPELSVSLSSAVMPEIMEYQRTSTTAVNAYVQPLMAPYLKRLEERLGKRGFTRALFLMLSGGGVTGPETARRFPVRLIESGPVGGVLAAAHLGRQAEISDLLVFDMGGTTAKACLVKDGVPRIANDYEVDRVHRFKKGSGTPVGVPTVDIIEIGAGGGSIAAIDGMGLLTVGPESSGADPGPICYRQGGEDPSVTDADLVLGYLDPDYFLGGEMALDRAAARAGIERSIGAPLGYSDIEAAWAIHEVVNENMASAIRMYATEQGGDAAAATVVAFGGAGPVHADGFARKLGASRIVVPRGAGVFSALGFLVAPIAYEVSRTRIAPLAELEPGDFDEFYRDLEEEAERVVRSAAADAPISFERAAEVRYLGQGSTVRVPLDGEISSDTIAEKFLAEYQARYGEAYEDQEIQLATLRVTAVADRPIPEIALPFGNGGGDAASKGEREAYDPDTGAMIAHKVYRVESLPAGAVLDGPAIVEEDSSTLVIGARARAEVDPRGWITVELEG
jgi:N-methylhydantoinase A